MRLTFLKSAAFVWLAGCTAVFAALTPQQIAQLPSPANHPVDFTKEIKPIFESSCIKCHGRGRNKGGLQIDSRETLIKGGDSGPAVVPGKSAESYLIELVQGFDPDSMMPKKGTKLTPEQIGLLRAWIDQGMKWDANVTFGRVVAVNLTPRRPEIPAGKKDENPIDRFLAPYFAEHHIKPAAPVDDRTYMRRVYLDVVGLLPTPEQQDKFKGTWFHRADRKALVHSLLADNSNYAQQWMTFWNDALRNDYRGTGYIDGGRKQITGWLYAALATNMPYNRFVAQLINPTPESEGFTKGIVWRGAVSASQTPQMQAAQNISQVFMGVNLKCASCHDSFINDLTLADAYGLAGIYADGELEMVHCDKPTGKKAELKFLYPELGKINAKLDKGARLQRLAQIITERTDARLTRTMVNRVWQKFMGRALIDPVDDMEKPAWNQDLLDWLAEDFADHNYDVKHLIELILTSRAYQMPAASFNEKDSSQYVFTGPLVRRMTSEQFRDAVAELTGVWYEKPDAQIDFTLGTSNAHVVPPVAAQWVWNVTNAATAAKPGTVYFRKAFKLESIPNTALAFIAVDNSFTLYVNGKKAQTGNDFSRLFVTDIRKHLIKGENTIAIEAVNGGDGPNPAGLFFYACLRQQTSDKKTTLMDFASDHSWQWSDKKSKGWEKPKFAATQWKSAIELGPAALPTWNIENQFMAALAAPQKFGKIRSVLVAGDTLQVALGRPNREQTVTTRISAATTLEALELTNGRELTDIIHRGAKNILEDNKANNDVVPLIYARALGRKPTAEELKLAREIVGSPAQPAGVEDLLWAVTMLPEYQLIY